MPASFNLLQVLLGLNYPAAVFANAFQLVGVGIQADVGAFAVNVLQQHMLPPSLEIVHGQDCPEADTPLLHYYGLSVLYASEDFDHVAEVEEGAPVAVEARALLQRTQLLWMAPLNQEILGACGIIS